ncbi:hypothetical protein PENFLA_c022G04404 [Penicillium flavigenum]|uniref:Uncharacterized protein n=1 Tax=Penicillium flavigenum TaxID=254877 RepID=A0A1V6SVJ8_9EURO|nr:hypothetical protein PENFLA_c022G04404 [Penicillium flavigenum]
MLFSSGSSISGRESVEVPEEKANIQSLRGEVQDLAARTEQFHIDFLVCLVKRNSHPPQDDPYRPQHNPKPAPPQQETSTATSFSTWAVGLAVILSRPIIKHCGHKSVRSGVFGSEINVGNHGDDKGHGPEMIGRNIGKKGMGGPGINVGNHSDEESDEDSYLIAHWGQRKKKKVYGPDAFVAIPGVPIQGIGYPSSPFTVVLRLRRFLD